MKAQNFLKTLILSLTLATTIASTALAADVAPTGAADTTVSVPAAPGAEGADAPATSVRVIQRILDESAANSDNYCVHEQRQVCNYYGCFYQWRYICYPW